MKISGMIAAVALAWLVYSLPLRAETVTLNLKDADIGALISTVAEVADKNFIVDPRVKGKVTVISSRPMSSDELYQVFLSILKVHGFAAVPTGEVIKIIPDVNAKQDSIPTTTDREPGRGDEMVTRVIQVDNVAAAQLVPILRPLVPQQGHLAAYPATNVLIISDRANNVERLVSIIRRIDQVSDSEIEVIPLAHASANARTGSSRTMRQCNGTPAARAIVSTCRWPARNAWRNSRTIVWVSMAREARPETANSRANGNAAPWIRLGSSIARLSISEFQACATMIAASIAARLGRPAPSRNTTRPRPSPASATCAITTPLRHSA